MARLFACMRLSSSPRLCTSPKIPPPSFRATLSTCRFSLPGCFQMFLCKHQPHLRPGKRHGHSFQKQIPSGVSPSSTGRKPVHRGCSVPHQQRQRIVFRSGVQVPFLLLSAILLLHLWPIRFHTHHNLSSTASFTILTPVAACSTSSASTSGVSVPFLRPHCRALRHPSFYCTFGQSVSRTQPNLTMSTASRDNSATAVSAGAAPDGLKATVRHHSTTTVGWFSHRRVDTSGFGRWWNLNLSSPVQQRSFFARAQHLS